MAKEGSLRNLVIVVSGEDLPTTNPPPLSLYVQLLRLIAMIDEDPAFFQTC